MESVREINRKGKERRATVAFSLFGSILFWFGKCIKVKWECEESREKVNEHFKHLQVTGATDGQMEKVEANFVKEKVKII